MKIKCWGTRGSLPTPGCSTVEFGGNTTCIQIDGRDGSLIIIDAGSGIRALGNELFRNDPRRDITLLITHAHWDHLMGFPFFMPAYSKKYNLKIMGGNGTHYALRDIIAHQFKAPYFPVKFRQLQANIDIIQSSRRSFKIGKIQVDTIPLNHPGGGVGYRFTQGDKRFVFLTDNELGFRHKGGKSIAQYEEFARDADLLLHDAQYTTEEYERLNKSWGHSSFDDAFSLAVKAKVKKLGFCHHDQERSDEMLSEIEACYGRKQRGLKCFATQEGAVYLL